MRANEYIDVQACWLHAAATFLALGAVVSLAACGSPPGGSPNTPNTPPAATIAPNTTSSPAGQPSPPASAAVNGSVGLTLAGAISDTLKSGSVTCSPLQGAKQFQTFSVVIEGTTTSGTAVKIKLLQNMFTSGGTYTAGQGSALEMTTSTDGFGPGGNGGGSLTIAGDGLSGSVSELTAYSIANPAGPVLTVSGTFTCGSAS